MVKLIDAAEIAGTRTTADGYLVANVKVARTGMQDYAGWEMGFPDKPRIRIFRDEAAVFNTRSLGSYAHKPLTNDHPMQDVNAENWKDLAVGSVGDEIVRDGDSVRIGIVVMDAGAIQDIRDGKRELSAGYDAEIDFTPGKTADGLEYDARLTDLRINHVAIVERGRAGSAYRIGDADGGRSNWGAQPLLKTQDRSAALRTITVDGMPIEVNDQAAAAISNLQTKVGDLTKQLSDSTAAHTSAVAAKDSEIGELKIKLKTAQDSVPTGAALDALVAGRTQLVADAKAIAKDIVTDGKTDAEIRRSAVAKKFGDAMVEGQSDEAIAGMFRAASKVSDTSDPIRDALAGGGNQQQQQTDNGQAAYEKRLRDAYKSAS